MEEDSENLTFIQIVEPHTYELYILRHDTNIVYFRAKNVTNCVLFLCHDVLSMEVQW